jgi:N-acetylated-alpha-linked acidic dipeptidase
MICFRAISNYFFRASSWDGEEYGLLGSTAYAERHNATLVKNAVAYLNVDTAVTGSAFSASATPSLSQLIRNVTQNVTDPNTYVLCRT